MKQKRSDQLYNSSAKIAALGGLSAGFGYRAFNLIRGSGRAVKISRPGVALLMGGYLTSTVGSAIQASRAYHADVIERKGKSGSRLRRFRRGLGNLGLAIGGAYGGFKLGKASLGGASKLHEGIVAGKDAVRTYKAGGTFAQAARQTAKEAGVGARTVFRRIRGRIIPIRVGQGLPKRIPFNG